MDIYHRIAALEGVELTAEFSDRIFRELEDPLTTTFPKLLDIPETHLDEIIYRLYLASRETRTIVPFCN